MRTRPGTAAYACAAALLLVVTSSSASAADDIVLYAASAPSIHGKWQVTADAGAAGGSRISNPDAGAPKIVTALAAPTDYFELTFTPLPGVPYRLWMRGRAQNDYYANDSVHVQFSGSVDATGSPVYRIGTTDSTVVNLEDGPGAGLAGWGWQDNGYGVNVFGAPLYFDGKPQTIRVQVREDGFSIDQIVLSPTTYMNVAPGTLKNDTTILPETLPAEVLLHASAATTVAGLWQTFADPTAVDATAVGNTDMGAPKATAAASAPASYVDLTFRARAGVAYRLWIRGRADNDYWGNDSVFVQFSNAVDASGNPVYRIGTTDSTIVNLEDYSGAGLSGWGWQDNGYGQNVLGPLLYFNTTAPQTIRLQIREDGFRFDQIVLSSARYLTTSPGSLKNDTTLLDAVVPVASTTVSISSEASLYAAITDTVARPEPALPALGPAGSSIVDPTFGSSIYRVTDGATRPGYANRSFRTPSSPHQNAWSSDSKWFYVISDDGTAIPFAFDESTGTASRIAPTGTGDGGLVVPTYVEPEFSHETPGRLYIAYRPDGLHSIGTFDLPSGAAAPLLNLDSIVPGLDNTYIGGIASSAGTPEQVMVFFGGASQDQHHYVILFNPANPTSYHLLDSIASTIDGVPTDTLLDFSLHHAAIDLSGRYVLLYPSSADQTGLRQAAQEYVWDTTTNHITELSDALHPYGHDAHGYGVAVNQDCCTTTAWDAAQWQLRSLATPASTRDVILPVLQPKEVQLADHATWHNARPDALVPFFTATYRYGVSDVAWRAWDNEILAVQTDMPSGQGAIVWRLAHHRSDVSYDGDPTRTYFWYMPRPTVSPDGRFVLFTSNWDKTLGTTSAPQPGGTFRQDVFALCVPQQSCPAGAPSTSGGSTVTVADASSSAQAVTWTNVVKATVNATAIQKTAGCDGCHDSGAVSAQAVDATAGGYVEFTPGVGKLFGAGLGTTFSTPPANSEISFGLSFAANGTFEVREGGVYKADGAYTAGDTFRITIGAGGLVTYARNGTTFYTSKTTASAGAYALGVVFLDLDASLSGTVVKTP